MKKVLLAFLFLMFFGLGSLFGQVQIVSGIVTGSEDGMPIPGVSVFVKGTTVGTVTSADGKYSLKVPEDAETIVFSFVGMETQEVSYDGQSTINVKMVREAIQMDEVVVTALGIRRSEKSLGYAVQGLDSDEITKTGSPDLSKALQGKVAGVDIKVSSGMPGASSLILIRGVRSFSENNTPLYVIDGMPIESTSYFNTNNSITGANDGITGADISNRAVDIDPNDIESINVLKGQAAAALYGLRASNGVVIITTKSGKGGPKGKTVVTVNQTTSFDKVSRTPDYQATYAQGMDGFFSPTTSSSWGPKVDDLPDDPGYGGNTENKYTNENGIQTGKYYLQQRADAGLDPWVKPGVYKNWDNYYRTGVSSTTSINVSKATEEGHYAYGGSYTDQEGIALNTGMKRWNAKGISERKLNDNFSVGFSANYSNTVVDKLSGGNDASLAGVLAAPPSYDLEGIPSHVPGDPYKQIYYRTTSFDNPYWIADNNTFNEETNRFFGNGYAEFMTSLGGSMSLQVKYQLGVDAYTSHYQDVFGYGSYRSSNNVGSIDNYGVTETTVNSLLTANYDWKISGDMDFGFIAGNEFDHTNSKDYEEYGESFNFGGWNHISNAKTVTAYENKYKDRTVGFFYSASWSWKDMVYLNTTGRNDIVSSMPRGNRSFFYPSVSFGVVISELQGIKEISWLDFAKIRGSYAEVGQAGEYVANFYGTPSYGGGFWKGTPVSYPMDGVSAYTPYKILYDPGLKPQNTKSYEIGVNLKMFKGRFSFDYTFSKQNVKDQIFNVPLAGSSGVNELKMNGGAISTDSHEFMVGLIPVKTSNFMWDIGVNFSKVDNVVDELAEGVESIFLGGFVTPQVRAGIGYTYPVIYGTAFKRNDAGQILVDEDPSSSTYGMPMAGKNEVIGSVSPDFILGWNTSFTFKNISLAGVFEWKNGGEMYSGSNGLMDLYGVSERTEDRESTFLYDGYKTDGTPNDIVRGGSNDKKAYQTLYYDVLGNVDEYYIHGNSFIKLRELSLGYQFPKKVLLDMDIFLNVFARNILIWTELDNLDPECSQGNTNMMGSFERFSMPQTTSYGFGVQVKF